MSKHFESARFVGLLCAAMMLCACATQPPVTQLDSANVLPMDLNEHFQFRKVDLWLYEPASYAFGGVGITDESIQFEVARSRWGAIDDFDAKQLQGNYLTFFWRNGDIFHPGEQSDVTIRLEYRQAALANYVKAREVYYPGAKGSYRTQFKVIGDEYLEGGRVTAWRALLIVHGRIVALRQSFMWK